MAASPQAFDRRVAVVVMGVSGCGKSTVAQRIARTMGLDGVDGDDLHSAQSVAKMSRGIALCDDDRWPWLDRIGARLSDRQQSPAGVALACSALRRAYRDRIRAASPGVCFVFLDGSFELVRARIQARKSHFMSAALLASQFETLERPTTDEHDVVSVSIDASIDTIAETAAAALRRGIGRYNA